MSELSDKFCSSGEIKKFAVKNGIQEQFYSVFENRFEEILQEIINDQQLREDEYCETALEQALAKSLAFQTEMQKGHSKNWSQLFSEHYYSEEDRNESFKNAFFELESVNKETAIEELKIECRAKVRSQLFTDHFIFLIENLIEFDAAEQQSAMYEKIFQEQIALGKSEIFSHYYADYVAEGEYVEAFAFGYASAYDNAINNGKSKEYAEIYAQKVADYYGDNYSTSSEIKNDDFDEFKLNEIKGYMKAWEYIKSHPQEQPERFIAIFVNNYINSCAPDSFVEYKSEEDLDLIVLQKTLDQHNKLK